MKIGLTELVMILDRSGSMCGLEEDTIGGYNAMLEKQKMEDGEVLVSTVLFDDRTEVLHDRVPIGRMQPITGKDYYVRGCTALLDAIGGAIHHIGNVHKYAREEDRPEKTLFIITTDGYENASRQYSYAKVREMIERQKECYHWEFIFLGANMDAVEVAGKFGVAPNRAVRFESDRYGTRQNYEAMSDLIRRARRSGSAAAMSKAFDNASELEELRNDYREFEAYSSMTTQAPCVQEDTMDTLKKGFSSLDAGEQELMSLLYGMSGKTRSTYEEAGRELGLSAGRVRQVESKVIRKIRAAGKKGREQN